ncbi:MAG: hypothetical protein ACMUEL_01205 [Flavobacteriales bacterium Tduv]
MPKGDPTYVIKVRKEKGKSKSVKEKERVKKETQSGVETQGKWLKKSGKLYYGYKKNIGVDKNGILLAVHIVASQ